MTLSTLLTASGDDLRYRIQRSAFLAGLVTGVLLEFFLVPRSSAIPIVIGVFLIVLVWKTFQGSSFQQHSTSRKNSLRDLVACAPRSGFVLKLSLLVFVVSLSLIPLQKLQGGLVEWRLRSLSSDGYLTESSAKRIAVSLTETTKRPALPLAKETLITVRNALLVSESNAAITDAAASLASYSRAVAPVRDLHAPKSAAERAFLRAGKVFVESGVAFGRPDREQLQHALSLLDDCIKDDGVDSELRAEALLLRANINVILSRHHAALGDIDAAEVAGNVDISSLVALRTSALIGIGGDSALREVVKLTELGVNLTPPGWLVQLDPRMKVIYLSEQYVKRALAFYRLHDYRGTIVSCVNGMRIAPSGSIGSDYLHGLIVAAYAESGDIATASEWVSRWARSNPRLDAKQLLMIIEKRPRNAFEQIGAAASLYRY